MDDPLYEINTALLEEPSDRQYDTLESVLDDLEQRKEAYKQKTIDYGTLGSLFFIAGPVAQIWPELAGPPPESNLTGEQLADLVLVGGPLLSIYPLWKTKNYREKYKNIDGMMMDLEFGDYSEGLAEDIAKELK